MAKDEGEPEKKKEEPEKEEKEPKGVWGTPMGGSSNDY